MKQGTVHPGSGRVGFVCLEVLDDQVVLVRIGERLTGLLDPAHAQGQPVTVGQQACGDGGADALCGAGYHDDAAFGREQGGLTHAPAARIPFRSGAAGNFPRSFRPAATDTVL